MATILNPNATIKALESILFDAGEQVVAGLDSAFSEKLASPEYQWPGTTKRQNGQTVGSPRDIIDTGELDSSQRLSRAGKGDWLWVWTAPHALIVHEGATLRNGGEYPARRWTRRAVVAYNPVKKFAEEVRKRV
jgi:hypothetical protein